MTAEQWQRVKGLYEQARKMPSHERSAFLSQACGDDEQLRQEVESLLEHGEKADVESFLVTQIAGTANGPLTGTRIAHYTVGERIGVGGMGEVYRGKDTKLGRDVALKVLPPAFVEDRDRRGRFAREARVLASLNHQHIAAIYGLEEAGDVCALVLELVEGPTLADRLQAGSIPMKETLGIARQLAEALEAAHEKGIVHRDLKPANIKITSKGKVKVLDFGLAKALVEEGRDESLSTIALTATRQGMILGTPAYMSPEQATGQNESIDERADVWAFGCVLYEMLTGRRPFVAESVSDLFAAVLAREPDWEALPEAIPQTILDLLRRCLAKNPNQRVHIAAARLELDEFALSGMTGVPRTRVMPARTKRTFGVVAGLAVLLVGAIGVYLNRSGVLPEETVEFRPRQITTRTPEDPISHAGLSLDGEWVIYNDNTAIYIQSVDNPNDVAILSGALPNIPPDYCFHCARFSWSRDGTSILSEGEAGTTKWGIWQIFRNSQKVELFIPEGSMGSFSPENPPTRLVYWKDDKFRIRELNGGGETELPTLEGVTVLKWSPDGKRIVYLKSDLASGKSSIVALKLDDRTSRVLVDDPGLVGMDFSWTRGGLIYTQAAASEPSTYDLWQMRVDVNSAQPIGAPLKLMTWDGGAPGFVSVSDDAKRIVTTRSDYRSNVYVRKLSKENGRWRLGEERPVTNEKRTDLLGAWTADGKILFYSKRDRAFNIFKEGKSVQFADLLVQGKDARSPQISPDGQWLLYSVWPDSKSTGPVSIERTLLSGGGPAEKVLDANAPGGKTFSPGDERNLQATSPEKLPDYRCPSKAGAAAPCVLAEAGAGSVEVVFTYFDPMKGRMGQALRVPTTSPSKFFWDLSADGSRLAYGEFSFEDDGITVLTLTDQTKDTVIRTRQTRLSSLSWSADGQSLFVTTSLADGSFLYNVTPEGKEVKVVPLVAVDNQNSRWISDPRPSTDGRYLAYTVQTIDSNVWLFEERKVKK